MSVVGLVLFGVVSVAPTLLFWIIWIAGLLTTSAGILFAVTYYRSPTFRSMVYAAKGLFTMLVVPLYRTFMESKAIVEKRRLFDTCICVSKTEDITTKTWKNITLAINTAYTDANLPWTDAHFGHHNRLIDDAIIGQHGPDIYMYFTLPPRNDMLNDGFKLNTWQADQVRAEYFPLFSRPVEDADENDSDEDEDECGELQ